jgi:cardiolipin synthase
VSPRDIPNLITFLRLALVPPTVAFLFLGDFGRALVLFAVAGLSDGLDGFLARRFDWGSRLGAFLDPLADKLLMLGTYLALGWREMLPLWLVGLIVLRDVVIMGGAVAYHFKTHRLEMAPMRISKINTALQVLLVILVLAGVFWPAIEPVVQGLIWIVALTTLASGVQYVRVWSRRAAQEEEGA